MSAQQAVNTSAFKALLFTETPAGSYYRHDSPHPTTDPAPRARTGIPR